MLVSEMSQSEPAPECQPRISYVSGSQSVGSPYDVMTGLQLYAIPNVLFVELRHPDAFLEFCIFVKSPIEGASWLWNPFKHMIGATKR